MGPRRDRPLPARLLASASAVLLAVAGTPGTAQAELAGRRTQERAAQVYDDEPAPAPASAPNQDAQGSASVTSDAAVPSLSELLEIIARESEHADDLDEASLAKLGSALHDLRYHAVELANDERAQAIQMLGLLTLARAQLALGNETAAAQTIDEAFRCAGGRPLDAAEYGPRLSSFVDSRAKLTRTTAQIDVRCDVECEVYLQERRSLPKVKMPKGGNYRIVIRASRPADRERYPDTEQEFVLDADRVFAWPMDRGPEATAADGVGDGREGPRRSARRSDGSSSNGAGRSYDPGRNKSAIAGGAILSAVGLVGVGTGAALLGIDGRCQGGGDVAGPNPCPDLYATSAAGAVTLSIGAVALIAGITTVAVASKRRRQARR